MHKPRLALLLAVVLLAAAVVRADAAPVLTLTYQPTKAFRFTWTSEPGANHYKLFEDPTGNSGFTQVSANIAAPAITAEHIVPLYRRVNARYKVQACNFDSCVDSNVVTVSGTLAHSIGYFKASNPNNGDEFGRGVALSSDGATLAVGARLEDSGAAGVNGSQTDNSIQASGAVYVFVRSNGSGWVQQAYIKASNPNLSDQFGRALALSANGSLLAVGSDGEDGGNAGVSGAVYVYERVGAAWAQQAYIKASNIGADDHFGGAVALSGDGRTLAVGAPREDSNAVGVDGNQSNDLARNSGAAYVFVRSGSTWSQQAYVKASNTGVEDGFGVAVDLSNDGSLLAVGASGEDSNAVGVDGDGANNSAMDSGAVYVYQRLAGSLWQQQAYLKASNTDARDGFGAELTLSGNGLVLAIGARDEDSNATGVNGDQADDSATGAGAVYVYGRRNSLWTQQAYLKGANTEGADRFGSAVALSNDGATLAVGAFGEASNAVGIDGNAADNSMNAAGAAYVFARNNGAWTQLSYVKASNSAGGTAFGQTLALSGNAGTLAVGSTAEHGSSSGINGPQVTPPVPFVGAVYVY